MATVHLLRHKRGDTLKLTIAGKLLVTGEGEGQIQQTFPSAAAAAEHLERVLNLRRREGYTVVEVTESTAEAPFVPPDPLVSVLKHEAARGRTTITFRGAKVPRGLCTQIVARLAEDAPTSVQIICDHASPGRDFAAALEGKSLPSIRAFIFDTHFQTVTRQRENSIGDLGAVLAALPNVERVFASGKLVLSGVAHEALRELYLFGDPIPTDVARGLGRCRFPALETLAVSLCSDAGPGPDEAFAAAIRALAAPRLATLHLDALEDVTAFLRALAAEPLPPSWSSVSLGGSVADEDDLIATLKDHAERLRALRSLGLPLSDISEEGMEAATEALPAAEDEGELPEVLLPGTYGDW
ncbi:hypothetical protein A7982_12254 [Minicystis rosea]|nr:hypothetical protein A7982_12254 [Minicystis rosea]